MLTTREATSHPRLDGRHRLKEGVVVVVGRRGHVGKLVMVVLVPSKVSSSYVMPAERVVMSRLSVAMLAPGGVY